NAIPGTADRFTRSIAAASLPAFSRPPTTSNSYPIEMTWPRGSRRGSEKTPTSRFTCVSSPVSSRTSRTTASTVVSPNSTKPPGRAGSPRYGSFFRRTATSFPPWRTIPSTATEGCACANVRSLPRGHPDPVLVCEANGVLVARVGVAHDTHSRVRRQDAHDPSFRVLGAVAYEQGPGVRRVSDPHTAAVVDGYQIRAGGGVQQRVQQRPVRDRIGAVPHPLRLAVRGRHRARVQMIPRDDDRPAELARRDHAVDRPPELRPLSVSEPTHPGREALPREVFLREADPPGERRMSAFGSVERKASASGTEGPRGTYPPSGSCALVWSVTTSGRIWRFISSGWTSAQFPTRPIDNGVPLAFASRAISRPSSS